MVSEDQKWSPRHQKNPATEGNSQNVNALFSPRFKSAAAMAGWDEEALLLASLIVEDTPDRDSKHKRRSVLNSKTPPTNSRRKRRAQRSPQSIPVAVLDLDEEETPRNDRSGRKKKEKKTCGNEASSKVEVNELNEERSGVPPTSSSLPCIDKLREELSCAICLEICFEPSTTPCGHSFCRKCLRSAADKCGKRCPKCRQLISNGRSCTVNTVLWNTIQLLFPQDVEFRKSAGAINIREAAAAAAQSVSPETAFYNNIRNGSTTQASTRGVSTRRSSSLVAATTTRDEDAALARRLQREIGGGNSRNRTQSRRGVSNGQDEDAALALRLQRDEFMQAFRGTRRPSSITSARENLRALASRAMDLRIRDRRV